MITPALVRPFVWAAIMCGFASACREIPPAGRSPSTGGKASSPATQGAVADDGQWLMAAKDHANTRYSGLGEITAENVATLKPAWTFSTGVLRGHEGAPLVVGSTMYVVTPYPNVLYALDLALPGAPVKWAYKPRPLTAAQGVACCDVVNRGAAFADGKVFFNTLDNHVVAVDAETGQEAWNTQIGDIALGETLTMAPIVVKGKVIVGNSGGEMSVSRVSTRSATGCICSAASSSTPRLS